MVPGAAGAWDGYSIVNLAVLYRGGTFHMLYGASAYYRGPCNVGYASSSDGSLWVKDAGNPLPSLAPGPPGAWDDWGRVPFTVLEAGTSYRMWSTAVQGDAWGTWRIDQATSADGHSWTIDSDPVLEPIELWEGTRVFSPEVIPLGDGFAMWYSGIGYVGPLAAARVGYATSANGLTWRKWPGNPVLEPMDPPCDWAGSLVVIVGSDAIHGWFNHCSDITYAMSPFEVFSDGFEAGNADLWSVVAP